MRHPIPTLLLLSGGLLSCFAYPQAVEIPHTFEAGEPARAAEVNENFTALAEAIQASRGGDIAAVAVVAAQGGDYASPVDAALNVETGDQWCREPAAATEDPEPCLIVIMPGRYEIDATMQVPAFVSVVGSGAEATIISAVDGLATTVLLGSNNDSTRGSILLRDVGIENHHGDGSESIALSIAGKDATVEGVFTFATGSADNISIQQLYATVTYRALEARAEGGTNSTGLQAIAAGVTLQDCLIRAANAATANRGIQPTQTSGFGGGLTMTNCQVFAFGGSRTIGLLGTGDSHSAIIRRSSVYASNASDSNIGIIDAGRGGVRGSEFVDVIVEAGTLGPTPPSSATAILLDVSAPARRATHWYERVRARASATAISEAMRVSGQEPHGGGLRIVDSVLDGGEEATESYGVRFVDEGSSGAYPVRIDRSELAGASAAVRFAGPYGAPIQVALSQFSGPIVIDGEQEVICAGVYDADYAFYADACPQ